MPAKGTIGECGATATRSGRLHHSSKTIVTAGQQVTAVTGFRPIGAPRTGPAARGKPAHTMAVIIFFSMNRDVSLRTSPLAGAVRPGFPSQSH